MESLILRGVLCFFALPVYKLRREQQNTSHYCISFLVWLRWHCTPQNVRKKNDDRQTWEKILCKSHRGIFGDFFSCSSSMILFAIDTREEVLVRRH
jgi:hypothetical protein